MRLLKRMRSLVFIAATLAGLMTSARAATPIDGKEGPQVSSSQTEPTQARISAETALVNLDVLVTDKEGRVLAGLRRENFRILDNNKIQTISRFEPASTPITIAMLMEYSGHSYDWFAYKAASWSPGFLNHLEPEDWVALVTYDLKPRVRVDFTRNKLEVEQAIRGLSFPQFREANMFGAIVDTLDQLDRVKGKKALLLISTGANTFSSHTLDDTYRRIKESGVTIFTVGIAEQEHMMSVGSIHYLQAKNQLRTFAELSGGMSWFPRFEGELPDIFRTVAGFLRSQYSLGFSPDTSAHDGKYHKLKVQIVRPDGTALIVTTPEGKRQKPVVHAREGYMAPSLGTETKGS